MLRKNAVYIHLDINNAADLSTLIHVGVNIKLISFIYMITG